MKWVELSVKAPAEFVEPLSQIFYRYGHGGVAVETEGGFNPDEGETSPASGWVTLKTYLPLNSTTDERRGRIDLGVRLVGHVSPISALQERVLDEEEWQNSWKEHFHVLHVGRRIVVCPSWRRYRPKGADIVITLDPGMAFGTGHHPTTRRCLEELEARVEPGMRVLDVGCGSGILSIATAKLGASSVLGLEVDSVSVGVAKRSVRENGVAHEVRILQGSLPHPQASRRAYDLVVANISTRVVSQMAVHLVEAVRPGGRVIASGLLLENRDVVERALASAGSCVRKSFADDDWVTLVASVP